MELRKDLMLYEVLRSIEVKNKRKEFKVEGIKHIAMRKTVYNYKTSGVIVEPEQRSQYISYIPPCTLESMLYTNCSTTMFIAAYVYFQIIATRKILKSKGIYGYYNHNVKINKEIIADSIGISKRRVYKALEEVTEKFDEAIYKDDSGFMRVDINIIPLVFLEEDGSVTLNYALCPFENEISVLASEERLAIKRYRDSGTCIEKKKWEKTSLQPPTIYLSDIKKRMIFTEEEAILKYVAEEIDKMNNGRMIIEDIKVPMDFNRIAEIFKKETGVEISEQVIRKSLRLMSNVDILIECGRNSKRQKLYAINTNRIII